jgi:hypothetical protein
MCGAFVVFVASGRIWDFRDGEAFGLMVGFAFH